MIDKTPISGFLHYRTDLGDGVRTGIVFSFCREACRRYCFPYHFLPEHRFTSDTAEKSRYSEEEMISYLKEEKTLCYTQKLGISFLGAEPLQDPFFCKSVAKGIKELDMDLQVHTCGMCSDFAYDLMDSFVDLYVLRLFSLGPLNDCPLPDPAQVQKTLELFEKRGYDYRIQIPVIFGVNTDFSDEFASFLSEKKYLKSVILDFSHSQFSESEIISFKESFVKKKIPLFSL